MKLRFLFAHATTKHTICREWWHLVCASAISKVCVLRKFLRVGRDWYCRINISKNLNYSHSPINRYVQPAPANSCSLTSYILVRDFIKTDKPRSNVNKASDPSGIPSPPFHKAPSTLLFSSMYQEVCKASNSVCNEISTAWKVVRASP